MDKSKAIKQSAEMFSNHLYENRKAKYKNYIAERKWFEKVVDDFEKHENIHILDWDIIKDTYRNNICVRFTDDNYPQYDVMHLVFDLFHSLGEKDVHYVEVFKSREICGSKTLPLWEYSFPFNKHCISKIEYAYNYYVEKMDYFGQIRSE